jgi:hypothetical protein
MRFRLLAMFATVVSLTAPTLAHHSLAGYDQGTLVTARGTLTEISWVNPHASITLAIKNPDGSTTSMKVEMAPPGALMRKGFDQTTLRIGDALTLEVWRPKNPTELSYYTGRALILPDGRRFDVGDSLMWQELNVRGPNPTQ